MPSPARRAPAGPAILLIALMACGGSRAEHEALARRVDSLAQAVTVLGERAGLQNRARPATRIVTASTEGGLREGARDASFVLVEFTDYYCPYCATFAVSALGDIVREGRDLEVIVRNYPIAQIHPEAARVASIVECLADTDTAAAWKLHHQLFARQASLSAGGLDAILTEQLPPSSSCRSPSTTHPRVDRDLRDVNRLQLQGTPALILGRRISGDSVTGLLLPGAYPAAEILRLLDSLQATSGTDAGAR